MALWRQVVHGIRRLLRRGEVDGEVSEEVAHFLEEAARDLVSEGMSPAEARRRVRLQYGDGSSVREDVGRYGWDAVLLDLGADLRLAVRRLSRTPGFTAIVVLILGLGIGSTTAIVSAVGPVLFEPLDYPDADRIVSIADRAPDGSPIPVAFGTFLELSRRAHSLESLAVAKIWQPTLTGGDEPERLEAQQVSAGYFDVLGVLPRGRGFDETADRPGGANQVVLSDGFWRRRFAADPSVLGRTLTLDGDAYLVVGIMPEGFQNVLSPAAQVWGLLQYDPLVVSFDTREWGHHLDMVGRRDAGSTHAGLVQELAQVASTPLPEFPRPEWASMQPGLAPQLLRDAVMSGARPASLVLVGAVALLLAVACSNLIVLLLAQDLRRTDELTVRSALGAGRARLVRQILTEKLVLVGAGGVLGVAIADAALGALLAMAPPTLDRLDTVGMDGGTLLAALTLTTSLGVLVGLVPALARSRVPGNGLRTVQRTVARSHALTRALVSVEVALALVLLIGTGLLLRSTERLFSVPAGFEPDGIVVMQVHATGLERGDQVTHGFWNAALEAVGRLPGVTSAALTNQMPLSGDAEEYGVTPDATGAIAVAPGSAYRYGATPGYLEAMGIEVLEGRSLEAGDVPGATRVAVVSASLAARHFPGESPLGRDLTVGPVELDPYTIVGVVENVKQESLDAETTDAVYVTPEQWHWADRVRWLVVKADDPLALVPAIRQAVWSADRNQPIVRVQLLTDLLERSEAQRRFVSSLLTAFALSALLLSAMGLYGVLAGSVTERTREIGVRAALGAPRGRIVSLVVRQGLGLAAIGAVVGVVAASAISGVLSTFMFGVSRHDPLTYLGAALLMLTTASVACWLPAFRASRVDPLDTLRAD